MQRRTFLKRAVTGLGAAAALAIPQRVAASSTPALPFPPAGTVPTAEIDATPVAFDPSGIMEPERRRDEQHELRRYTYRVINDGPYEGTLLRRVDNIAEMQQFADFRERGLIDDRYWWERVLGEPMPAWVVESPTDETWASVRRSQDGRCCWHCGVEFRFSAREDPASPRYFVYHDNFKVGPTSGELPSRTMSVGIDAFWVRNDPMGSSNKAVAELEHGCPVRVSRQHAAPFADRYISSPEGQAELTRRVHELMGESAPIPDRTPAEIAAEAERGPATFDEVMQMRGSRNVAL